MPLSRWRVAMNCMVVHWYCFSFGVRVRSKLVWWFVREIASERSFKSIGCMVDFGAEEVNNLFLYRPADVKEWQVILMASYRGPRQNMQGMKTTSQWWHVIRYNRKLTADKAGSGVSRHCSELYVERAQQVGSIRGIMCIINYTLFSFRDRSNLWMCVHCRILLCSFL